jgi:hypothetical protein
MKMSAKSVGLAAWMAVGLACVIYAPMAIEYMAQYVTPRAPELYLHSISAVISLNRASQVGSLVHHQLSTCVASRWIMLVHTAAAGLVLFFGMLQFSARVRRKALQHGLAPSPVGPPQGYRSLVEGSKSEHARIGPSDCQMRRRIKHSRMSLNLRACRFPQNWSTTNPAIYLPPRSLSSVDINDFSY